MDAEELFAPPAENWMPLHPNYRKQQRLGALITWLLVGGVLLVWPTIIMERTYYAFPQEAFYVALAITIGFTAFQVWRQDAIYRAWGFAERESDLYIRKGVWVRRLTVIPYGRMQAVEVKAGPLQRAFKLASVQLVTASPESDATIPGLPAWAAVQLRDRLTFKGENQAAGL